MQIKTISVLSYQIFTFVSNYFQGRRSSHDIPREHHVTPEEIALLTSALAPLEDLRIPLCHANKLCDETTDLLQKVHINQEHLVSY